MKAKSTGVIHSDAAPKAIGPYSQAIEQDGWIFLSGQVAIDPETGQVVDGGVEAQTERVLKNLEAVLAAAGGTLGNVVKTTVYLKSLDDFARMNETYARFFKERPPARATVEVSRLPRDVRVEIDAIARL